MYRILKIGMDVHTTNFTLCALESKFGEEDVTLANITVGPDHKNILDFVRRIKEKMDPKGIEMYPEFPDHITMHQPAARLLAMV